MTTRPASPARALHDILDRVQSRTAEGELNWSAWGTVSHLSTGGAGFARYHAEAMELLSEVAEAVATLSPAAQDRYRKYLPAWWNALVRPRNDWQGTRGIIDASDLDHLASLADVLEAMAGPGLDSRAPEVLYTAVGLVIAQVEKDTGLPHTVREQILADLRHVQWLLENVGTFGVDHAVAAAEKVTGRIVRHATTTRSGRLRAAAVSLATALTLISGATGELDKIVTDVRHMFGITAQADDAGEKDVIHEVVVEVYNACVPKQLTAAPTSVDAVEEVSPGADEVVDAEVIEEEAG